VGLSRKLWLEMGTFSLVAMLLSFSPPPGAHRPGSPCGASVPEVKQECCTGRVLVPGSLVLGLVTGVSRENKPLWIYPGSLRVLQVGNL